MMIITDFEKKTISYINKEEIKLASGNVVPVYTINSINELIQFVGYAKYINHKNTNVFIRGQVDLYSGSLVPSLFRGKKNFGSVISNYYTRINQVLQNEKSFKSFPKPIFEATIQHYGIKTPMIDLVDNLWVALWFASHQFQGKIIGNHEHLYVSLSNQDYGYIILICCDAVTPSDKMNGLYQGENTQLIDLRKALPSYYLRPHSQHAFMLRKKETTPNDYSDLIVGLARIRTQDILRWIGDTELLSTSSLFPSAYFDNGYEVLLKKYPSFDNSIIRECGSIQIISD